MNAPEIAKRYASALYKLAAEEKQQDAVFNQIRELSEAFNSDAGISAFLASPLIRPDHKEKAFATAFNGLKMGDVVKNFVFLLARKQRLTLFKEIVTAYQDIEDQDHGVVRGSVRSTTVLAPEQRKRIEETVNRVAGRRAILTYKEDPSLLGGLVADVGSYTFDDSLASHLRRMKEQLMTAKA